MQKLLTQKLQVPAAAALEDHRVAGNQNEVTSAKAVFDPHRVCYVGDDKYWQHDHAGDKVCDLCHINHESGRPRPGDVPIQDLHRV